MRFLYSCFSTSSLDLSTEHSIKAAVCPEWLRYFDYHNVNSKSYLCLLRNLYCESVSFDFQFSRLLPSDVLVQHIREVLFVAVDSHCRNREILRLYIIEQCEHDASLSLSLFYFCQLNWDDKTKRDNHLFLQKLRVLSLPRVQSILPSTPDDSSILCTLYNNSVSFFNTLFSLSTYLYTTAPTQRQTLFTDQCDAINQMTLAQCMGIWLPLHHGVFIKGISTKNSKVLSTKARCPCIFQFEVTGAETKANKESNKAILESIELPPVSAKPSFFSWISSFFVKQEPRRSIDIEPFPTCAKKEDSVIVVADSTYAPPPCDSCRVIVKTRDTMRQEEMAAHIIAEIEFILRTEKIPSILRCYEVLAYSDHEGMIDYLEGFLSLHEIKKNITMLGFDGLGDYFAEVFKEKPNAFRKFRRNFIHSLAAYSIVCYILQIKDRNDGNILMDKHGVLVHIDFGFILSNCPGNIRFETAPFKLTTDMMQLVGAPGSSGFYMFQSLCIRIFEAICNHRSQILAIVQLYATQFPELPCFSNDPQKTILALSQRLEIRESPSAFTKELIRQSIGSWTTHWYDQFQFYMTGIF